MGNNKQTFTVKKQTFIAPVITTNHNKINNDTTKMGFQKTIIRQGNGQLPRVGQSVSLAVMSAVRLC
jgi:hypothetical protein